ncbi:MAG: TIGR02452 family protein, partial [Muribaculaceae bacterium]|nr:TIGR02452 family protein [Muribaculaceae bacterium]
MMVIRAPRCPVNLLFFQLFFFSRIITDVGLRAEDIIDPRRSGYKFSEKSGKKEIIFENSLRKHSEDGSKARSDDLIDGIKNKMRTVFRIGLRHGHDSLVLGAWGCGAFCNPPEHIAELFKEVLEETEFRDKYREIIFSIIDDHNSRRPHNPEGNILPFLRVFGDGTTCNPVQTSHPVA